MIEFVPAGVEVMHVRVLFEWNGNVYLSDVFEEFADNTAAVPDAHQPQPY